MEFVRSWIEKAPYGAALGVELDALAPDSARLRLPFRKENSNPGDALHGGCAASLAVVGGQALARAALGEASGPWHTCALQVNYLSAAIGEEVFADVRLLRQGKEVCFVEVDIETEAKKAIAHVTSVVRGRFAAPPGSGARARGDAGESDPGPMGPHIGRVPFIASRGIRVELMRGGRSRLVMPYLDANADAGGGVHEGALLALFDTTGAMAAWAESGPGNYRASTPSLQAQILGPPPRGDLVGYGSCVQRDGAFFWSDVEIADASDGRLAARGTVFYRILT